MLYNFVVFSLLHKLAREWKAELRKRRPKKDSFVVDRMSLPKAVQFFNSF